MRQLTVMKQLHEKFNIYGNALSSWSAALSKDDKVLLSWKARYRPSLIMVKDLSWRLG